MLTHLPVLKFEDNQISVGERAKFDNGVWSNDAGTALPSERDSPVKKVPKVRVWYRIKIFLMSISISQRSRWLMKPARRYCNA